MIRSARSREEESRPVPFAILALALSGVGVYGVLAFVVRHRTREIGVLMAVGAPPGRIACSIIGDALRLAAIGLAIGFARALVAARVIERLLFGVRPQIRPPLASPRSASSAPPCVEVICPRAAP